MRSSLKKSLYLGLAALSFASVAGTSLSNLSASAKTTKSSKAKKHAKKTVKKAKKAKKAVKTYAKISSVVNIANQDASTSAFTLKSGTLTNKPAGTKNSHDTVTGLTSSELFMAYQKVTLNNGQVFYKVVSFNNRAHRGFVNANDVTTTATYTPTTNNKNTNAVYLANPGNQALYSAPQGATFKDQTSVKASLTGTLAGDPFGINQIANIASTGRTAYHIVDLNNNSIQGWVDSSQVTNTANRYFDSNSDLRVNFNYNGSTVASQIVNVTALPDNLKTNMYANATSNDRVLTNSFVQNLFSTPDDNGAGFGILDTDGNATATTSNGSVKYDDLTKALGNLGYVATKADFAYSAQSFGTVKVGDTINVNVSKPSSNAATSKLAFKSITPNSQGQWNPADEQTISSSEVNFPALTDAQAAYFNSKFSGNNSQFFDFSNLTASNNLFNPANTDGVLATFDGAKSNVSITSTSQYTNGANGVLAFNSFKDVQNAAASGSISLSADANKSRITSLPVGRQFHYAYVFDAAATSAANAHATLNGQPLTIIYDKVPVATNAATTTTSGYTGYLANN